MTVPYDRKSKGSKEHQRPLKTFKDLIPLNNTDDLATVEMWWHPYGRASSGTEILDVPASSHSSAIQCDSRWISAETNWSLPAIVLWELLGVLLEFCSPGVNSEFLPDPEEKINPDAQWSTFALTALVNFVQGSYSKNTSSLGESFLLAYGRFDPSPSTPGLVPDEGPRMLYPATIETAYFPKYATQFAHGGPPRGPALCSTAEALSTCVHKPTHVLEHGQMPSVRS
ncbi:hypothetical protein J6590_036002 [Homalodisca vitripennis]|nr:hypothetical protein J6590_036002 [Homalodisca vitripennis]